MAKGKNKSGSRNARSATRQSQRASSNKANGRREPTDMDERSPGGKLRS